MIIRWSCLAREAWFVSWSKGSQLEPNDGGAGARLPVSGSQASVQAEEEHSLADPGLAWLPVITVTQNAGGDHKAHIDTF